MSLTLKVINVDEWDSIVNAKQANSLFYQSQFHTLISEAYHKTCTYYAVKNDSDILIALPIFHKSNDASLITHFFYQVIYYDFSLSERKKIEAFNFLVSNLIKIFNKIDFKLEPDFLDVRAFVWNGFQSSTYYSYHINTNSDLNYSENVKRQLKKNKLTHTAELAQTWNDELINKQLIEMVQNGLSKRESNMVKTWLKSSFSQNFLDVFILKSKNLDIDGSAIYLKSKTSAYLIAIMSDQSNQALLYDKAIEHYKSEGILEIDLLGANIPNVAIYK